MSHPPGCGEVGGVDPPGGKLIKIRQEVADTEACPGSFGGVRWSNSLLGGANAERCKWVLLRSSADPTPASGRLRVHLMNRGQKEAAKQQQWGAGG